MITSLIVSTYDWQYIQQHFLTQCLLFNSYGGTCICSRCANGGIVRVNLNANANIGGKLIYLINCLHMLCGQLIF